MDPIKATLSLYSYSSHFNTNLITKSGTLCKLPLPKNNDEFHCLYTQPFISYSFIRDHCSQLKKKLIKTSFSKSNFTINYSTSMSRDFSLIKANKPKIRKNENETDAFKRSKEIGFDYFTECYKENNRIPTCYEYRKYYRENGGTGQETEISVARLKQVYKYLVRYFNPAKLKSKSLYNTGEYITALNKEITKEEINNIVKNNTNYRYKVIVEDIDVALGYYFINLMRNKEQKEFSNKELTVPANDITKWFQKLKEQGQIKRSCCRGKAKAIRVILQELGYIECVDVFYSKNKHVSQRWAFLPKFPKYSAFINYIGIETVNIVRKEGKEYAEYKKNKKSRKDVA